MSPDPVVAPPRPGDIILVRAIKWLDSGQIQRALWGIAISAAPFVLDMVTGKDPFTWRAFASALTLGLFAWMGVKRAKSPDIVTGLPSFDKANVEAKAAFPAGPKATD